MTVAANEPAKGTPWRLSGMALCERCRLHFDPDELELMDVIEVDEPELWCSQCRFRPSGWAS